MEIIFFIRNKKFFHDNWLQECVQMVADSQELIDNMHHNNFYVILEIRFLKSLI